VSFVRQEVPANDVNFGFVDNRRIRLVLKGQTRAQIDPCLDPSMMDEIGLRRKQVE